MLIRKPVPDKGGARTEGVDHGSILVSGTCHHGIMDGGAMNGPSIACPVAMNGEGRFGWVTKIGEIASNIYRSPFACRYAALQS